MRWRRKDLPPIGTTVHVTRFALLPTRMDDGTWVWLERYDQTNYVTQIKDHGICWAIGGRYVHEDEEPLCPHNRSYDDCPDCRH